MIFARNQALFGITCIFTKRRVINAGGVGNSRRSFKTDIPRYIFQQYSFDSSDQPTLSWLISLYMER